MCEESHRLTWEIYAQKYRIKEDIWDPGGDLLQILKVESELSIVKYSS